MSLQNIIDGNGIGISIVGILVVFIGLFLIFLFISGLPWFLSHVDALLSKLGIENHGHGAHEKPAAAKKPAPKESKPAIAGSLDSELAAVVAYVVAAELEHEALSDYTKITIRRDDSQQVWGVAGKMRTLANRKINFSK